MASVRECIIKLHPWMKDLIGHLECPESYAVLPSAEEDSLRKSATRSDELIDRGCKENDSDNYDAAYKYFNEGLATAPPNSSELAFAYYRRSAVWMDLDDFENCLLNSNRALSGPLPDFFGNIAVANKLECWGRLQLDPHLSTSMVALDDSVHQMKLSADMPCPGSTQCSRLRIDTADITPDNLPPRDPIWETKFNNPLLPNVSSKVKIVQNVKNGRHYLSATEDIEPGEILWIQDYYSMMTMEKPADILYSHCSYCTGWCEALIPCLVCTKEMYCSLHCRESAYNAYHRIECKLLPFLPKPIRRDSSATIRLSLRTFLTGTKQGADLNKLMKDPEVFKILEKGSNCVGVPYVTNDYLAILNLWWRDDRLYYADSRAADKDCRALADKSMEQKGIIRDNDGSFKDRNDYGDGENHSLYSPEEHPVPDEWKFLFVAIFSALKRSGYFDEKIRTFIQAGGKLTDAELFACILLLQNLLVLKHGYRFILPFFKQPDTRIEQERGWMLLGSIADLMNHSCVPNTATIKHGRKILTYSLRPIKAGQQLFTSYERSFTRNPLKERQEYLQLHYDIVCRCPACVHDWPLEEALCNASIEFSKAYDESVSEKIREVYNWWKTSDQSPNEDFHIDVNDDLGKVLQYSKIIHEYIEQPSILASFCERCIRRMMNEKGGNQS